MLKRLIIAAILVCGLAHPSFSQTYAPATFQRPQYFDNNGNPCNDCTITTYASGTANLLATYSDISGTALPNPIRLNTAGRPQTSAGTEVGIFLSNAAYRFVMAGTSGTIYTQDNVRDIGLQAASGVSGTQNRVTKYASGSGLTASNIFDDGSTVAVGATTTGMTGSLWVGSNATTAAYIVRASGDNSPSLIYLRKARGNLGALANVQNGDTLGETVYGAYSGSWFDTAQYQCTVDAAVTNGQRPATRCEIFTNANNAAPQVQLGVDRNGLVYFQGQTSSFPALKRSSAILQVRLGDDSAYASFEAASIGVGGAVTANRMVSVRGAFAPSSDSMAVEISPVVTVPANQSAYLLGTSVVASGSFAEAVLGNHALLAVANFTPPTITAGAATVGNTAMVYILTGMTATVTGANYAIWVDDGTVRFDGNAVFTGLLTASTGDYMCFNTTTQDMTQSTTCTLSSKRYKHDIAYDKIPGLDLVNKMKPVRFVSNIHPGQGEQFGFIAEDVDQVEKRLVYYDEQGRPNSVMYENYVGILTKAVQELSVEVEKLKRQRR